MDTSKLPEGVDHVYASGREVPANLTVGRCTGGVHDVGVCWPAGTATLSDVRCPLCASPLQQTTRMLGRRFYRFTREAAKAASADRKAAAKAQRAERLAAGTHVQAQDLQPGQVVAVPRWSHHGARFRVYSVVQSPKVKARVDVVLEVTYLPRWADLLDHLTDYVDLPRPTVTAELNKRDLIELVDDAGADWAVDHPELILTMVAVQAHRLARSADAQRRAISLNRERIERLTAAGDTASAQELQERTDRHAERIDAQAAEAEELAELREVLEAAAVATCPVCGCSVAACLEGHPAGCSPVELDETPDPELVRAYTELIEAELADAVELAEHAGRARPLAYREAVEQVAGDLDYDDVIDEAKRLGYDPYNGAGEYRPAAISDAIRSLSRAQEERPVVRVAVEGGLGSAESQRRYDEGIPPELDLAGLGVAIEAFPVVRVQPGDVVETSPLLRVGAGAGTVHSRGPVRLKVAQALHVGRQDEEPAQVILQAIDGPELVLDAEEAVELIRWDPPGPSVTQQEVTTR
jgi:hypothetical protein